MTATCTSRAGSAAGRGVQEPTAAPPGLDSGSLQAMQAVLQDDRKYQRGNRRMNGTNEKIAPAHSPPPRWLAGTALMLRSGVRRLANLLVPPQLPMFELIAGVGVTMTIHAAARLRIADHLAERPLDAEELAARTGL